MRWSLALVIGILGLCEPAGAGPLFDAASQGDLPRVRNLLEQGVAPDEPGRNAETPLMAAALSNDLPIAEILIDSGADVMARNRGGLTPLHAAAYSGSAEVAEILLAHGADLEDRENIAGATPLVLAAEENRGDVARLLIERGADVTATDADGFSALTQAWAKKHSEMVQLLKTHGAKCQPVEVLGTEDYHRSCLDAGK